MADTQQNILINIDVETGQVNSQLDQIDQKIGSLGQNANIQSFKSIKSEILAAREEAVKLAIAIEDAEASGENVDRLSERYSQVTQRAAQLNDAVGKVNDSIANANPDNRLQGLISVAQGAATAVQGVAGAFALVGVDAEDAQVVIAKLQGLIALTDSISSIDKIIDGYKDLRANINFAAIAQRANNAATAAAAVVQRVFTGSVVATGTAFKALKVAIASTGIGLLVIAITAAIVAIASWISSSKKAEEQANRQKEALDALTQAYDDETKEIEQANKIKLLQLKIQGASELKTRQEQYNQLKVARDRALKLELDAERIGGADLVKLRADRIAAQNALEIQGYQNELADKEDSRKKLADIEKGKTSDVSTEVDNRTNKQKQAITEINQFTEEQREIEKRKRQTDLQNQIDEINKRYERALSLAKAFARDTTELEKLRSLQIAQVTQVATNTANLFILEESFKVLEQQVRKTGEEIQKSLSLAGSEKDVEAIKKIFNERGAQIEELFQQGAKLRQAQITAEKEVRLDALKALTLTPEQRDIATKLIEEDFKFQLEKINEELQNSIASIEKGVKITLIEVDLAKANEEVAKIQQYIERLLTPFQKIGPENDIARFFRRTFTTLGADLAVNAEKNYQTLLANAQESNQIVIDGIKKASEERKKVAIDSQEEELQAIEDIRNTFGLEDEVYYNSILEIRKKFAKEEKAISLDTTVELLEQQKRLTVNLQKAYEARGVALRQSVLTLSTQATDIRKIGDLGLGADIGRKSFSRDFLSSKRFKEGFDAQLKATEDYYGALFAQENAAYLKEKASREFNAKETEELERKYKRNLLTIEEAYVADVQTLNDTVLANKLQLYNEIGAGLGQLGQLFDQNKKVQAGFALAEIAINTATGFVNGLKIAQQTSLAKGPAAAYVFPIFYAQQVAAVLAAANRAKGIIASIKGGESASSSSSSAPASTPTAINASLFNLPPEAQNVRVVNQASQVVRAYITNEDLRSAQEKQAFLNKLSSF